MTAAPLAPEIQIDEHASAGEAHAFLEQHRIYGAYAIADLDGEAAVARWWIARREQRPLALLLVVESLPFRPTFAVGDPQAIGELVRDGLHETRVLVSAPVPARPGIEAIYRFERCDLMQRMAVDATAFRPRIESPVTRLGPDQLDDIIELYGHVSRSYFTPERVSREIYYGVYSGRTLVAAAGTHVQSSRSGLAAVGNVLTRPAFRSQGMATSVTSAVTEAALALHRDVVLNVRADNSAAVRVYQGLGYRVHAPFIEGPAIRRAGWERFTHKLFRTNDGGDYA